MNLSISEALQLALKKHQEGSLDEAKFMYEKILEVEKNPDALHLLGVIAYHQKEYKKAIEKIEEALKLKTSDAGYYINLGLAYDKIGNEEKAKELFERALKEDKSHIRADTAHFFLGVYHSNLKEFEKAFANYEKAIEINKELYDTHFNRALIYLLLEKFEEGWKDYEYRFVKEESIDKRVFNKPKWKGENFNGKKILVITEQGFGDNIQFIRYLPLIKERGGEVILECRRALLQLFENFPGIDKFILSSNNIPEIDFDYYIHIMSLPMIFNTNLSNIPNKTPYLNAKKEKIEKFKSLFNRENLKVGMVWQGNSENINNKRKSIDFDYFKKLTGIGGIDFYSLQMESMIDFDDKIKDLTSYIKDFTDTAALIENLDLIISVDTAIVHLAGAMNKRVWTLLPFIPDWRWMLDRDDSVWYPSMKLFRQKKQGDWNSVFEEVEKELKNLVENRK